MYMFISYKGYAGEIQSRKHAGVICGEVVGITDLIAFQSATYHELEVTFQTAVEDYLAACRDLGYQPRRHRILAA